MKKKAKKEKEKEKKTKSKQKGKKAKRKGKSSSSSKSSSKSDSDSADSDSGDASSEDAKDPERVMSSLALQLSLSTNQLKLKGSKVLKIEDLSPQGLQFIMAHPPQHEKLPELSTFTLHECGGELFEMRRAAVSRLAGKVSKRKQLQNEELRTHAAAEEACKARWMKRLLDVYELLGSY